MKRTNKTRITITAIKDFGRAHELHCDMFLMLRRARRAGDSEVVNNYVLGILREHAKWGELSFTEERL